MMSCGKPNYQATMAFCYGIVKSAKLLRIIEWPKEWAKLDFTINLAEIIQHVVVYN